MKTRNNMKAQGGFTLIEVIAVLVIVGMLAAVAIPKYLDMQTAAAKNAVQGALAAGASNVTMEYSQEMLNGNFNGMGGLAANLSTNSYQNVGDFQVTYADANGTGITVTLPVTGAPDPIKGQMNALKAMTPDPTVKTVTLQ